MSSNEWNQPDPHDKSNDEVPELFCMLFGGNAAAAWAGAGERMLRWAAAFADWRRQRMETRSKSVVSRDKLAWHEVLGLVKKHPWELETSDVQVYVEHSLEGDMQPGTLSKRLTRLSKFYDHCQEHGLGNPNDTGFNPVKGITRPAYQRVANMRCLNVVEALALLSAIDREWSLLGKRDYAMFLMHLLTGLRSGEIRNLKRADLRKHAGGAQVRRQAGPDEVWVSLPGEVWDAIKEYLEAAGRWPGMGAGEIVFAPLKDALLQEPTGVAGDWASERPLSDRQCNYLLKKYARWAGLEGENITMHTLRNTATMLQVQAGCEGDAIQSFLGNKSTWGTQEYLRRLADYPPPPPGDPPQPTRDLNVPPPRGHQFRVKPGEQLALKHGFSAKSLPGAQVQAVIAEGIVGMDDEITGLRMLSRGLLAVQNQTETSEELAQLCSAYTIAADRLRVMIVAAGKMEEGTEQDDWAEAMLAMLDNFSLEMGEESNSQEIRELAADSDPDMALGNRRLTEEIASTRLVLRNTYQLAVESQTVKEQMRYTEIYGRGCFRLVRLLKSERLSQGSLADFLRKEIDAAILEVNQEWGINLPG